MKLSEGLNVDFNRKFLPCFLLINFATKTPITTTHFSPLVPMLIELMKLEKLRFKLIRSCKFMPLIRVVLMQLTIDWRSETLGVDVFYSICH